ncbi:MAG: ribose-phosphate pyrophosphokinase [Planctomycetes bacterium]|nr:ribose-phosphate pyrophosphokinase [Planctomycetota bacterium]
MSSAERLKIFSGTAHRELAEEICRELGQPLGSASVGRFPDGEIDVKINDDIRGADVFIVQPTCPPVNENLVELLLMIDCCLRASSDRITAVIPYFGYARKDRKDEGRVPISAKLCANMISAAGADRVLTIDLHASQIQGFFDIPVDHLYSKPVLCDYFAQLELSRPVVVAPDVGSIRLARAYASSLQASLAIVDKRRHSADATSVENVIGDVAGRDVVMVDDMISTGGSITEAARNVKSKGAERVYLGATHAVLCGSAVEKLAQAPVEEVVVSNTIPVSGEKLIDKIKVRSVAGLLARAIDRIHRSASVSALFSGE